MTSFVAAGDFDRLRREIKQYQTEQELELLKIGMPRDRKYTLEPTISRNKILEDRSSVSKLLSCIRFSFIENWITNRSLERLIDVDFCLVVDNTNSKGLFIFPFVLLRRINCSICLLSKVTINHWHCGRWHSWHAMEPWKNMQTLERLNSTAPYGDSRNMRVLTVQLTQWYFSRR